MEYIVGKFFNKNPHQFGTTCETNESKLQFDRYLHLTLKDFISTKKSKIYPNLGKILQIHQLIKAYNSHLLILINRNEKNLTQLVNNL